MNRPRAFVLCSLVACTGGSDDKAEGTDTATPAADCATPYGGPIVIRETHIRCETPTSVRFEAITDGPTSGGRIFSQETGNSDLNGQWADEHDLEIAEADPCGSYNLLEKTLVAGVGPDNWQHNLSTAFRCDAEGGVAFHHNALDVMSYAMRVYAPDGTLADCLAGGHDANGMINGVYGRVADPQSPGELAMCVVGVFGY